MGKILVRLRQAKYYILASVCASAVFGGLSVVGKKIEVQSSGEVICAQGDSGNNNEGQMKVAQAMKDAGCTTILHLGDLVYAVGLKSADDKKFKTHFFNYYEDFNQNIIALGNHDLYAMRKGMDAWLELGKRHSNIIYPSHFFQVNVGDYCVVSWNSEIVERDDDIDFVEKQGAFIDSLDLSKCKVKVSICHHPLYSPGVHGNASKEVRAFYEKHILGKFDYALSGHDHLNTYEGSEKGTELYVSGAGSELRKCETKSRGQCYEKLGFLKFVNDKIEFVFVE